MATALSRTIRILALLTLLLAGVGGHDMAVAGGAVESLHSASDEDFDRAGHSSHNECTDAVSQESDVACCMIEHCLLGVPVEADTEFEVVVEADPVAAMWLGLLGGVTLAPFRPPVSV